VPPSSRDGATTDVASPPEVGLSETLTGPDGTGLSHALIPRVPAQLFATSPHARRVRRPTDVTLLIATGVLLLVSALNADRSDSGLQGALAELLDDLPRVLVPLWQVLHDLLLVWALLVVVLAVIRRHWSLVRDVAVTTAIVPLSAAVVGRLALGEWPALWSGVLNEDAPVDFPPLALAVAVAVISVASPHLTRPYRYAGRWFVLLGALSFTALGITTPGHAAGAAALGWGVAAAVHLVFGSPGGLPSLRRVKVGLDGMGVDAEPLTVDSRHGVAWVHARRSTGADLDVKVYGRDAWDGQLLVSLWRFVWFRDGGPTLALSRLQQVEHEAFLTLLAARRGVPVAGTVAAGLDPGGDAILVTERFGRGLDAIGPTVTDAQLAEAWRVLAHLHTAGISHGGLEPSCVRVDDDEVRLSDFAWAQAAPTPDALLGDQAQLLVTTAVVAGPERAVAAASRALEADGLAAMSSLVQPAALSPALRRGVDDAGIDVDDIRRAVVEATDQPPRELQRLHRLSLGRVLLALILLVASWALISSLADIGIDNILDALASASGPLVVVAFVIGLTPRVANAVALSAAAPTPIPLGRLTALQFAISFVNLAMPSTAARAAVNIRFFQRSGVEPGTAVAVGLLDSVMGFVAQITLIVVIVGFSLGSLDLDIGGNLDDDTLVRLLTALASCSPSPCWWSSSSPRCATRSPVPCARSGG